MAKRKFLGEMLIDAGLITEQQFQEGLAFQDSSGLCMGKALIETGLVAREAIFEALGDKVGIPYVNLDTYVVDRKAIEHIPGSLTREFMIFPFSKLGIR